MPDDKVTFKSNGDYTFGTPLQEMDVHGKPATGGASAVEVPPAPTATKSTTPKKFDMSRLRRSASSSKDTKTAKGTATESSTPTTEESASKAVPAQEAPPKKEEPKPAPKATATAEKKPKAATPKKPKATPKPVQEEPAPETPEVSTAPALTSEEAPAPQSEPAPAASPKTLKLERLGLVNKKSQSESTAKEKATAVPKEEPKAESTPAVEVAPAPVEEKVVSEEPAVPEEAPLPVAPVQEDLSPVKEEPVQEQSAPAKTGVSELHLETTTQKPAVEEVPAQAPTTPTPAVKEEVPETAETAPEFVFHTLEEFLGVTGLDAHDLTVFAKAVVKAAMRGSSVWQSSHHELLRAYSCNTAQGRNIPKTAKYLLTLGWDVHVTSCYVDQNYAVTDGSSNLKCVGICAYVQDTPVALSLERKRTAVVL